MKKIGEYFAKHMAVLVLVIALIVGAFTFVGWKIGTNGATITTTATKLTFEDVGELATQSAYVTVITTKDKDQKVFNVSIPFTQTKYIYSYNVNVKAGYDFEEIAYDVDEENKEIKVTMPEAKILSTEVDTDSFRVYHEQNSAFTHVSLEETNQAMDEMQKEAQEQAIENGLYDEAKENAKVLLKGFFSSAYDMEEYTLVVE